LYGTTFRSAVHIIAWRKDMERRGLVPADIRRKLSALSSLFDYFWERNAVTANPVDRVKRPMANGNEDSTPALGDARAANYWKLRPWTRSRESGIGPSWLPCCITVSGVKSSRALRLESKRPA
jgi:hypothetical protein